MMTRAALTEELLPVLRQFAKAKNIETITEETDLMQDLKIRSATLVDIVLIFENKYGIEVDPDDMDEMFTVKETLDILERYINELD